MLLTRTASWTTRVSAVAMAGAIAGSISMAAAGAQTAAARAPARSLLRPASPAKAPDANGFIQRWLVLEPIRVSGQLTESAVQSLVKTQPFAREPGAIPHDGDTVTLGDTPVAWHGIDTVGYNVNLFHFAYALNKPTSNVLFWAVTLVHAPRELSGVRLAIGSNAASIWWVNGTEVIGIYNDRQTVIDDGVSKRLTLNKGPNVIRAAIVN